MDHQHVITLRQRYHFFKKLQLDALRRRIRRKAQNHHFRLRITFSNRAFQLVEEVHAFYQRHGTNLRASYHRTINMDRIARIWHKYGITMIQRRQHQVCEPFFRSDRNDSFAFWIDINLIAILIPARNCTPQARNPARRRITVSVRTLSNGTQFFDDMRRRWAIGITHAEIDNVFAAPTRSHFQFSSDIKNIRGETIDTRKTAFRTEFSHRFLRVTFAPGPSERRCHVCGMLRK
ncbi:hypothetical protein D3C80_1151860 [compost metagenome]